MPNFFLRNIISLFRTKKDKPSSQKIKRKKSRSTISDDNTIVTEVNILAVEEEQNIEQFSLLPIRDTTNYKSYKKFFRRNQILEIANFLDEQFCNELYNFLNYDMPEEWWYHSAHQFCENPPLVYTLNTGENKSKIDYYHNLANITFMNRAFAYSFYRTIEDHFVNCNCKICEVINIIKSKDFIKYISKVTGTKLTKVTEIFASRFDEGMFISPHGDVNKGKIGFVLYLTDNWIPEYGGILNISINVNEFLVKKNIIPSYNNLLLFYIPQDIGVLHFVSHVAKGVREKRLGIAGWFD